MAIRRPRIKPVANIGTVKRKVKRNISQNVEENQMKDSDIKSDIQKNNTLIKNECTANELSLLQTSESESNAVQNEDIDVYKDQKNLSKITDNINAQEYIQKPRQRIRATPCFDVRRNSVTTNSTSTIVPQTSISAANNNALSNQDIDKSPAKENVQTKPFVQPGNRTPNLTRAHRHSESSGGGFLSPTSVQHNPPNFFPSQNHQNLSQPNDSNSSYMSSSIREPPPSRYRKISSMEDTQKLSSARREFQTKYSRKSPEKSALKLCDFIFYNPSSNPMVFETKQENLNESEIAMDIENSEETKDKGIENENKQEEERAPVPQLKLGPNGEIILDEKSLVIETTAEKHAKTALAASKSAIYLDEYSGNNGFYSRQKRTKDWTPEETIKFYRCLHTIGTDFSMMLSLFPNRSRRDLKLKFKKEERNNVVLINKALLQPNTFDIDTLKYELEREEEIAAEKRKEESNRTLKLHKKFQNKNLNNIQSCEIDDSKTDKKTSFYSRTKNALSHGNLAYEIEESNLPNITKKKNKSKIKADTESDIYNISEDSTIKNESRKMKTAENISTTDTDIDDVVSVYSTNEFGYDESTGIEITDIGDILTLEDTLPEFKNSTLAIVSKHDKNNTENVTHGIYIICRSTGIMSQKPLDLPEETVNCILKAMGKI